MGVVAERVAPDTRLRDMTCVAQMLTSPADPILRRVLVEPEPACFHD
jgi:hypothetical protein